jgi:hypothetical protein
MKTQQFRKSSSSRMFPAGKKFSPASWHHIARRNLNSDQGQQGAGCTCPEKGQQGAGFTCAREVQWSWAGNVAVAPGNAPGPPRGMGRRAQPSLPQCRHGGKSVMARASMPQHVNAPLVGRVAHQGEDFGEALLIDNARLLQRAAGRCRLSANLRCRGPPKATP